MMGLWNSIRLMSQFPNCNLRSRQSLAFFHSSLGRPSTEDYHTLGVPENATKDEIKAAYFTKAKQFHPDSSKSGSRDSAEFQKLNEAYKRLLDKFKVKTQTTDFQGQNGQRYDQYDHGRGYRYGPGRSDHHWNDRYNHRDPRNYRYGPGPDNPWNEKYDDHRDPRNHRYGPGQSWNDQWERMHRQQQKPRNSKEENDLFRRMFLQIMIGFFVFNSFRLFMLENHKYRFDENCECAQCLERRTQTEKERTLEDAEHARAVYKTVY